MQYKSPPVVMDTNVLVAGACRHEQSPAYRFLMGVLEGDFPLMLTPAIALEYLDVLLRPRILSLTGLNHSESADLLTDLISVSRHLQNRFSWRPNLRDESDNKFVEAAINAGAIVVTYNVRHFRSGDLQPFGWAIMTPLEFVTRYLG